MGKFAERAKKLIANEKFSPLELTEDNVNTIYRRCLPKEDTKPEDIVENWIFSKKNGFSEDGKPFYFNEVQLQKDYKNIVYMLGQLYDVHITKDGYLYLKNFSLNYNNQLWIQSQDIDKAREAIFNLIALGSTVRNEKKFISITPLLKDYEGCGIVTVSPTLSPKDPKFAEWSKSEEGKRVLAKFDYKPGE